MRLLPMGITLFPFNPLPKYSEWHIKDRRYYKVVSALTVSNFRVSTFSLNLSELRRYPTIEGKGGARDGYERRLTGI